MRFGVFMAPFHQPGENPTLALERDLELIQWLDALGFDEAWVGEHHSTGWETIASPELFLAVAAERTRHIRLGTGVVEPPLPPPPDGGRPHRAARPPHPRAHQLRRRPGRAPHRRPHARHPARRAAAADGRGARRDRAPAHRPDAPHGRDRVVLADRRRAAAAPLPAPVPARSPSPAWSRPPAWRWPAATARACSRSPSPRARAGPIDLAAQWRVAEEEAERAGTHGAAARSGACRCRCTWPRRARRPWTTPAPGPPPTSSTTPRRSPAGPARCPARADRIVDQMVEAGSWVVGTPDDAVAAIERLQERSGGFGGLMVWANEWAPRHKVLRSYELLARHVMPRFQGSLAGIESSNAVARARRRDHRRAAHGRGREGAAGVRGAAGRAGLGLTLEPEGSGRSGCSQPCGRP